MQEDSHCCYAVCIRAKQKILGRIKLLDTTCLLRMIYRSESWKKDYNMSWKWATVFEIWLVKIPSEMYMFHSFGQQCLAASSFSILPFPVSPPTVLLVFPLYGSPHTLYRCNHNYCTPLQIMFFESNLQTLSCNSCCNTQIKQQFE